MPEKTLLSETRELVRASELTYAQIARGSKVKIDWLKQIVRPHGNIREPGVMKVQRVFNFLSHRAAASACAGRAKKSRGRLP